MKTILCSDCHAAIEPIRHGTCGRTGYAVLNNRRKICYACADKRQVAALFDRSQPFTGYLSSDGNRWTTWTGGTLGNVDRLTVSRSGWQGSTLSHVHVLDVHGNAWFGRGAGPGMCLTLRPCKTSRRPRIHSKG